MIAVDASALVAILLEEPDSLVFAEALADSAAVSLSPVGYWEAATRLRVARGQSGVADLDRLIETFQIRITPASQKTARIAARAEAQFGKRTAARLNLGDCFAYATAKELDAPLLYKGDDFSRTDVASALTA